MLDQRRDLEVVRAITVALSGYRVSAALQPQGSVTRSTLEISAAAESGLAQLRDGYQVPRGTPIFRMDRSPERTVIEFSTRGPLLDVLLPEGTMSKPFTYPLQHRPYQGQAWDKVGAYTSVALDVKVRLAIRAGITVEFTPGCSVSDCITRNICGHCAGCGKHVPAVWGRTICGPCWNEGVR